MQITSQKTNTLSYYKTFHHFERYAEITDIGQLTEYCQWAKKKKVNIYIIGNGSNTLFTTNKIKTLVIKNKITPYIKSLSETRYEISSSVAVLEVLKVCYKNNLDSFYYLASVPATVGGALAMNAGRGIEHGKTIYDFVESVTFYSDGNITTLLSSQIEREYRKTIFTGLHSMFIISAVFKFEPTNFNINPIIVRNKWSKKHQDNKSPNCGSVFRVAYAPILKKMMGFHLLGACYSSKTYNWILNYSNSSKPIVWLIKIVKFLHKLKKKKAELEIILVD
jgi:UDP-N-acetylmuramate dehydrogenase